MIKIRSREMLPNAALQKTNLLYPVASFIAFTAAFSRKEVERDGFWSIILL